MDEAVGTDRAAVNMSCPFKHLHGGSVIPEGHPGSQSNKSDSVDQHARGEVDLPDQFKKKSNTMETSGVDTASSGAMSTSGTLVNPTRWI